MNVLSLFDGISCGRVALERANINVTKYYASEIDKYAIQVSQNNYPDIVRLGDINNWEKWDIDWSGIDLILAGSPCQGFSFAGKQLAFDDKRSALFFRFAEILSHVQSVNPDVSFLLENVRMKKDYERVITSVVGVEPIMINSALVSAQNRKRLYWCNWHVAQPEDKGILLKDVIHETRDIAIIQLPRGKNKGAVFTDKSPTLTSNSWEHNNFVCSDAWVNWWNKNKDYQISKKYSFICNGKQKAITLTARQYACWNGNFYQLGDNKFRKLTPIECERLQTLLQYEKKVEIVLCLDQAKNFVNVVKKNHKLQQLVLNVENEELKEYVKLVSQSINVSQASTKPTAHQNVDTLTSKQIKKCTKLKLTELDITANTAEYTKKYQQAEREGNSADYPAFINITEGRITQIGLGVSHQRGKSFMQQMNGKIALELSGKEMVQNAKDVLSVLEMLQTNQHSTSITSFRLSTKNIEQILIICYWFAKNAIDGFIQDTTNPKILYLNLIDGYTAGISNSQRYKCLGNGWTVDVIAHILNQMNKGNNHDKTRTKN
ncbi:MAG: DNA cytosine methyltransferase [Gilliamella sp.]|nr:DNA cytosine methyltransferase [Gilliamella sp.]MCO6551531.1 DNA cytosine methyltransferase [Gilliamella sp.]